MKTALVQEMTPEMMRNVQMHSELGAYAAANLLGAYDLFAEFWRVAMSVAPQPAQPTTEQSSAVQPAQQEPVAYWISKAEQFCIADPSGRPFAKAWEPLYTTPQPAQRTWVGLTDEEKRQIFDRKDYQGWLDYINAIEAKLKENNNG